eukprot:1146901-Pelagomonas_calceolata.AAC.12
MQGACEKKHHVKRPSIMQGACEKKHHVKRPSIVQQVLAGSSAFEMSSNASCIRGPWFSYEFMAPHLLARFRDIWQCMDTQHTTFLKLAELNVAAHTAHPLNAVSPWPAVNNSQQFHADSKSQQSQNGAVSESRQTSAVVDYQQTRYSAGSESQHFQNGAVNNSDQISAVNDSWQTQVGAGSEASNVRTALSVAQA